MAKYSFSRRELVRYLKDAKEVKFLRRNPVIACEVLLGIKLTDSQKYILIQSWNKPYVCLNCSRNFGKSFLIAIIIMLKAMLYPNQRIYIVSNKGKFALICGDTYSNSEFAGNSLIIEIQIIIRYILLNQLGNRLSGSE